MNTNNGTTSLQIIQQMKCLLHEKIMKIIHSLENYQQNSGLLSDVDTLMDMMSQFSAITLDPLGTANNDIKNIDHAIRCMQEGLEKFQDEILDVQCAHKKQPPLLYSGSAGRPKYLICQDLLEDFIESDFTVSDIAKLLNVSVSTIKKNLNQYGLTGRSFSNISNENLHEMIRGLKQQFPDAGYRTIGALLRDQGHKVQRHRIRDGLRLVDPEGVLFRRLFCNVRRVQRRCYSVRAPRALWHIDGNHKLIRWRFIIHGAIDGYSRLPVFLDVNTDNKAETVLKSFRTCVEQWGLPERVRSDKGGENVRVAQFMLEQKGIGSFIAGRSVHNQRIERLWREVWTGCTSLFYQLFYYMEEEKILDIDNEQHMYALHFVFKKRIQDHLEKFRYALMRRPLRTERHRTPLQLWISGQILDPVTHLNQGELDSYGIDFDGPIGFESEQVQLEETIHNPLPDTTIQALNEIQLKETNSFGIDIFEQAINILNQ